MTDEEYQSVQSQLFVLSGLVAGMDLPSFLNRIYHCEAVAPIVDPTLWIKGSRQLEDIKRLAEAANELRRVALEVREKRGIPG